MGGCAKDAIEWDGVAQVEEVRRCRPKLLNEMPVAIVPRARDARRTRPPDSYENRVWSRLNR